MSEIVQVDPSGRVGEKRREKKNMGYEALRRGSAGPTPFAARTYTIH